MHKIDWKELEEKSHNELMAIIGKIDKSVKDAVKAGEDFCVKFEKDIKKGICGNKSSVSGAIDKENVDALVDALSKSLKEKVDTSSVGWEVLAAIAVSALKQGLNSYCENYKE